MLFQFGKKYRGYWESEENPVSVSFNEKMWKVVSVSDQGADYFFGLLQKPGGSVFYITGENLEGEVFSAEQIEEIIFARVYNMDNDVSVDSRFEDRIDSLPFYFVRYRYRNRKFGPQLANYGYNVFDDHLVIVSLAWPVELELSEASCWPLRHELLISGIRLGF